MIHPRLLPLLLTVFLAAMPVRAQDVQVFPERPQTVAPHTTLPYASEPFVPVDSLYYDDGDNFIDFSFGVGGADELYLAVRFDAESDFELTHVRFWGRRDGDAVSGDVTVDVYDGSGATPDGGTLLYSQTYPDLLTQSSRFRYVGLDSPLSFGAGEAFFIVVRAEASPEPGGPLGGDLGPGTGDYAGRSFFSGDGVGWSQAGDFDEDGFDEVFHIRAVTDDGEIPTVCDGDIALTIQAEVDAFDCTEVGGHLSIDDGFNEDDITDLSPLGGLESVGGGLGIRDNDLLASLAGLDNLTSLGGALMISENDLLGSLAGLGNLASVASLSFFSNDSLASFAGLEGLESAGSISAIQNTALTSFAGLERITSIGGDLNVIQNAALTSFAGLEGVTSLTGDLTVIGNASLLSLEGLGSTSVIGGDLELNGNASLTSLDGLEGVTSIGGGIGIFDNPVLEALTPLENLSTFDGPMTIRENSALESLAGLEGLTVIGGGLVIGENASLTSLESLSGLTTVEGPLGIFDSPSLASLDGLEGITSIGGELLIIENATLSDCACELAGVISGDPPTFSGVGGTITIENNAPDGACTSPQVVLDAFVDAMCVPVANEPPTTSPDRFALAPPYPNPFARSTTIAIDLPSTIDVRLAVYDVLGREVAVLADGRVDAGRHEIVFDAADLPSGPYFVRMTPDHQSATIRRMTLLR